MSTAFTNSTLHLQTSTVIDEWTSMMTVFIPTPTSVIFSLASPLADDTWEDARLLTAEESEFGIAEVCGTTIIKKCLTKGDDIQLFPTLCLGLELSAVHTVDATTTAIYMAVEMTTFMVPTGMPPLHDYKLLHTTLKNEISHPNLVESAGGLSLIGIMMS